MTNNDVLRRLRYTFDFSEHQMVAIFALADTEVKPAQITQWLKQDDDPDYVNCSDVMLATFLNGLISEKRGKKEGEPPKPEKRMNNNLVFRKLKIALNLQADDVLQIMGLSGLPISKHELSAFFRRADHKHYRECKDQILRNFLAGVQIKYRDSLEEKPAERATLRPKSTGASLYKSK
jgi:uncharacterized protein YehS (DUF1456 family)